MSEVVAQIPMNQSAATPAAPTGVDRLLAMGNGYWVSQIIRAATHYKFFTLIAQGHATVDAIAGAAKTDPRGTRMVLDSLVALDVLTKRSDTYGLTPDADAFLVEGRPGDLTPVLDVHTSLTYENWGKLTDALRDPAEAQRYADLHEAADFFPKLIRAILPLGLGPADATAEHLGIGTRRKGLRILDVGAGAAAWSIPFARRDASARITAFDLPEVLEHTEQVVSEYGVDRQFTYRHGDLMKDDLGESEFDVVILGNICHGLTPEQNVDLLERTRQALAPGGQLVIADMVPNEERTGPPFPVLFAVNMYVMGGEDTYTMSDYRQWLAETGYRDAQAFDTRRSHSPVIIAST